MFRVPKGIKRWMQYERNGNPWKSFCICVWFYLPYPYYCTLNILVMSCASCVSNIHTSYNHKGFAQLHSMVQIFHCIILFSSFFSKNSIQFNSIICALSKPLGYLVLPSGCPTTTNLNSCILLDEHVSTPSWAALHISCQILTL